MKRLDMNANQPISGCVTGQLGGGKSASVACAYPDAQWVVTRPDALRSTKGLVSFARPPLLFDPQEAKPLARWKDFLKRWSDSDPAKGARCLVIDEYSSVLEALYADLKKGGGDGFEAIALIKRLAMQPIGLARARDQDLILISHWTPAVYYTTAKGDEAVLRGSVKYPAGPKMPVGTMIEPICQELTFCWQLAVQEDKTRVWLTQPDGSDAIRKAGGFSVPDNHPAATPEVFREMLEGAGLLRK